LPERSLPSPFENDIAARELLEALRWPDGPRCPRCDAHGTEVFLIGGEKHSHREGLYQCKPCRRQFTVTLGTVLERLRVPMSAWLRAAREFSAEHRHREYRSRRGDNLVPLVEMQPEIGVSYRTLLRMRDIIKRAAGKYRGSKKGFGMWPRSFMFHVKVKPSARTIRDTGVLAGFVSSRGSTKASLGRIEQLLRLLLETQKLTRRKPRAPSAYVGVPKG
jgi:transposase-like protein